MAVSRLYPEASGVERFTLPALAKRRSDRQFL
jgi:hypothetical protein